MAAVLGFGDIASEIMLMMETIVPLRFCKKKPREIRHEIDVDKYDLITEPKTTAPVYLKGNLAAKP